MKLRFIGTGNITAIENSASYLVDDHILIDCGNGIVKALGQMGHEVNDIDLLIITHLHGDHFLDIPFLVMKRCFTGAENNLTIICPKGTRKAVDELMALAYSDVTDYADITKKSGTNYVEYDGLSYSDACKNYVIKLLKVEHGTFEESYGLILSNGITTIGFSGDSARCKTVEKIVSESDVTVLDTSFVVGGREHMGLDDITDLINKYQKPVYTAHMSKLSREKCRQVNLAFLHVPEDGDVIEV